ncbi:MAG: hypothetical protein JWL90_4067 [Chthoniobacteraceae bacterium]|nr:hypothetical protein [Chthoniobacteraceae bacterium]
MGGGVKRYLTEKVRFIREQTGEAEHLLIIPGERDGVITGTRSRIHTIRSPLISKTSGYRVLLNLRAIARILEEERPDLIECGDPYQIGWKSLRAGRALRIPVIGFYHSHFPEAYLRGVRKFLGSMPTEFVMGLARRYVCNLYNQFQRTVVPSPVLGQLLTDWGVRNVVTTDLGVDPAIFQPLPSFNEQIRAELNLPPGRFLLLYVGRLAREKNTHTLFSAFRLLTRAHPDRFHLLIIGDGLQRAELDALKRETHGAVSWLSYCDDPARLAQIYRAADLFVHPGVQETFGLVTLEAQACGIPVVGIRGTYMDRIIQTDQTLWARENSAEALAAAIKQTADCPPPTGESALRLHQTIAAQYSWNEVFRQLFAFYREVIHNFTPCD